MTSGGLVIAEANDGDLVAIGGNLYFPPGSVTPGTLTESATPYSCPWKGRARRGNRLVDGHVRAARLLLGLMRADSSAA